MFSGLPPADCCSTVAAGGRRHVICMHLQRCLGCPPDQLASLVYCRGWKCLPLVVCLGIHTTVAQPVAAWHARYAPPETALAASCSLVAAIPRRTEITRASSRTAACPQLCSPRRPPDIYNSPSWDPPWDLNENKHTPDGLWLWLGARPPALLSLGGILRHFVQLPFVIPSAILTRRRQSLVNTEVLQPPAYALSTKDAYAAYACAGQSSGRLGRVAVSGSTRYSGPANLGLARNLLAHLLLSRF